MTNPATPRPRMIAVVLAHNCARMLPRAYERIPKDLIDDIIVMDDGSTDGTSEVAKKMGLKVFRNETNRGYGGNIKEGLKHALEMGAEYVVEIHGDGAQFNPYSINYALEHIRNGTQLILGSRFQTPRLALKNGMPLIRYVANRFLSFFDRLVLQLQLTEFHTGFRIYGRRFLETVPFLQNSEKYLFSFEIIAQAVYYQMPIVEVPVEADYINDHTSSSIPKATIYAIQTFGTLISFLLAKSGLAYSQTFRKPQSKN